MNKIIPIMIVLMCLVPLVSALENQIIGIKIDNETITIEGFIIIPDYGKVGVDIFENYDSKIKDNINFEISCEDVIVEVNGTNKTYQENCKLKNITYDKSIILSKNSTLPTESVELKECRELKAQYSAGLDSCTIAKNEQGSYKENYTQCTTDIQICRSDKSNLEGEVNTLEEDIEDNKNRQWFFLIIGLAVGGLVILIKEGKIGGAKIKKEEDSFNPRQAA